MFQNGPVIDSCVGIIKEPENQTSSKLKEIYNFKLKLLQNKNTLPSDIFNHANNNEEYLNFQKSQTFRSFTTPN